jgi:protein-S-isoprenylcysteine O-methyltransferase Ste14
MDTGPDLDRLGPPAEEGDQVRQEPPFRERELRPAGRLRLWQTLPIAAVGILGALMFGFPLAFENSNSNGGGGVVVGMLGLLLVAAAVGWGAVAARRAGYNWPGLPRPDSGRRAGWRVLLGYAAVGALVLALAIWRVARLRG